MSKTQTTLKVLNVILFGILTFIGTLFLLASPANPSLFFSRLLVGIVLIVFALVLLIVISLLIQRRSNKSIHAPKKIIAKDKEISPEEIICKNCGKLIQITEALRKKDYVVCESCGEMLEIPKDEINW